MTDDESRRILIVDDNRAIHEDFKKILGRTRTGARELLESEAVLFGSAVAQAEPGPPVNADPEYQIDSAFQGEDGVTLVRRAREEGRPYAMAFVDARMPPGLDGVETAARIWENDPDVQIVICTAYSDHSWQEIRRKLVYGDRLVILKKPFDNIEVLQLAETLTERWRLAREDRRRLERLEQLIAERNRELQAMHRDRALAAAAESSGQARRGLETESQIARRTLADELLIALEADDLSVHYQPLVDIGTRRITSLEALLRWRHPRRGYISPTEFIPAAEESGLILALGEHVLRAACEQIARWEQIGVPLVPVAVNVSPVQLDRQNVFELVQGILRETGVRPNQLVLELTESAFIRNKQRQLKDLRGLRNGGVRLQIDDFGTGYSSLSYLRYLPVDTLKIDSSFIEQLDSNSCDETIISAILRMGQSLGLRVVAEGVESEGQLDVLRRHGCEVAQGFYFCRPMPPDRCAELLLAAGRELYLTEELRARSSVQGQEQDSGSR